MSARLNRETFIAAGLIVGLFVYVVLRAVLIPITIDEAATFFHYINLGKIWPGEAHWDANNHVLNSLLTWVSYKAFGDSEIALRIPNVLAGLLYLIFAYKLSFQIDRKLLRWALFLSLACSRLVLEFFSLTRGYGLSLGLLLTATFFMYRWMKTEKVGFLFLSGIGIQLATLANLSLLVPNLLFFGWVIYWSGIRKVGNVKLVVAIQLLNAAAIAQLVAISFELKERGLLYYGSDEGIGFWQITVRTLVENTFDPWGTQMMMIIPFIIFLAIIPLTLLVRRLFVSRTLSLTETFFPYLLVGCFAGNVSLHYLLGVNYPADRVALHYMLMFPCAIVFSAFAVMKNKNLQEKSKVICYLSVLPLFLIPLNLLVNSNISHSVLWRRDSSAKLFHQKLLSFQLQNGTDPTVMGYRMRLLPFNYYNFRNDGALSPIQSNGYRSDEADFQIAYLGLEADWSGYDTLFHITASDLHLMERKVKRKRKVIFTKRETKKDETDQEFIGWFREGIDSLSGKDLLWDIEIEMPEINEPFKAWISVVLGDVDHKQIAQEKINLHWLKASWKNGEKFKYHMLIPNIPDDAKYMKVFFWNIDKKPIRLGEVKLTLSEILEDSKKSSHLQ